MATYYETAFHRWAFDRAEAARRCGQFFPHAEPMNPPLFFPILDIEAHERTAQNYREAQAILDGWKAAPQIDTGDAVLHVPTGETWLVAFVEGDRLSWVGWPDGTASVSDCRLIEKATPEKRISTLRMMENSSGKRGDYARRVLAEETQPA